MIYCPSGLEIFIIILGQLMKVNNKKFAKTIARLYAVLSLICLSCTAISMLQMQTISALLFAFLTIVIFVMLWRLQYTEIEHEKMFISIKKRYLLENSIDKQFEMPYTEIRKIEITNTRFGYKLGITRGKDKFPDNFFRFSMTGMNKTQIDRLGIIIRQDLPNIADFQSFT